jgi:hypothetical protein
VEAKVAQHRKKARVPNDLVASLLRFATSIIALPAPAAPSLLRFVHPLLGHHIFFKDAFFSCK